MKIPFLIKCCALFSLLHATCPTYAEYSTRSDKEQIRQQVWAQYQLSDTQKTQIDHLLSQMSLHEKAIQLASKYPNVNDRLSIPHLQAGECLHGLCSGYATSFPQALALGSTWDPDLIERASTLIAKESRILGSHQCYSPNLGLARDPRWGRFEECYGEDPVLVAQIGKAFILGLQGRGEERFSRDRIIATGKHFVADGRPQSGANGASEELSERILHELYLKPYRVAVQESLLGAIMPAHHSLNGEPCHSNTWLLQEVLRDEYGFDGIIVCDNGDIKGIKDNFNIVASYEECAKLALEAGVNSELAWMCEWGPRRIFGPALIKGVEQGLIAEACVNKAVAKILQFKMLIQIWGEDTLNRDFGNAVAQGAEVKDYASTAIKVSGSKPRESNYKELLFDPKSDALALEVANKAITLLKNDGKLLPLQADKLKSIALIGPNADDKKLLGTYSTSNPRYFVTVKEGLEKLVGDNIQINYAKGVTLGQNDSTGIAEAVAKAQQSDVVILVLGDNKDTIKENQDRDDIALPGLQNELMEALVATGKPLVLVLLHGRTPALEWADKNVPAILSGWFLGQETGTAIAQTLFGINNPGGKTTVTYPRSVGILPQCYNDLPPGRKHSLYQSDPSPLYPFGHGLSYTQFEYSAPRLSHTSIQSPDTEALYVEVDITNTGQCAGDEVVQMYIRDEVSSLLRPLKELKDFKRITLAAGETKTVRFSLGRDDLEFWKKGEWIVESGSFQIMIGGSSATKNAVKLTLE